MQTYMLIQEYSQAHKQGAGVCLVWAHTPWKGKFVKGNRNVAGIRKNKIMPSAATQTDLEMVTLSEVRHLIFLVCGIEKNSKTDLLTKKKQVHRI